MNQAVHPGTSQLETSRVAEHNSALLLHPAVLLVAHRAGAWTYSGWGSPSCGFCTWVPPAGSWGQTVVSSSEVLQRSKAGFWAYLFLMPTVFTNPTDPPSFLPPSFKSHCCWILWRCQWGKTAWVCFWAPWLVVVKLQGGAQSLTEAVSEAL